MIFPNRWEKMVVRVMGRGVNFPNQRLNAPQKLKRMPRTGRGGTKEGKYVPKLFFWGGSTPRWGGFAPDREVFPR